MPFIPVAPPRVSTLTVSTTSHPRMFVMPDLVSHCTLDLRAHEESPRVVWECKTWMINGSNIFRKDKTLNLLHGLKAGELACACYPMAPLQKLRVCCDFMVWLFHIDDLSDDMDDRNTITIGDEIMTTYRHPDLYELKTHVGKLTKSYWTRLIAEGSPGSQKRFVHAMDLFFKTVVIQARDRAAGIIPDLQDYVVMRRDSSGGKPCLALIEYANGLDLPDDVMEHQIMESLYEATNDLVTWSNDIFSYNREQAKADTHNMIVIMMHHHGMNLQQAVDFVGDLCKKSIDRFTEDRARLPSWGPEIDGQVQVYIQGLADWIVGSLHWSFDSERYFGKKGLQIKKNRMVELAPVEVEVIHPAVSAISPAVTEPEVRAC